jgi:hypothetical protein
VDGQVHLTRVLVYVDDGYIKGKLSVDLQVLAELKRVLKEDEGLELNVYNSSILHKHITQQTVFDVTHSSIDLGLVLTQLSGDVALVSFCPEGFFFSLVSVCLLVRMLLYGTL